MSLDVQQLYDWFVLYSLHADYLSLGEERTVAMLGMMCCCAARWERFRDTPPEWEWPRAVCSRVQEVREPPQ